jgi:hypothetical protein
MLLLVIASQLAAAFPIDAEKWFSPNDYPSELSDSLETVFQPVTQTLVDPDGKIIGCRVETASPSPKMDALACAIILKRGRFEPARWMDGTAVPGVYRWPVTFMIFGDSYDRFSDIELQVGHLPEKKKAEFVTVAFSSDPNGRIDECVVARPVRSQEKPANPQLVAIACKAVQADWKPFTVLGKDGKPSRSVQNAIVKFTTQKFR